MQRNAAAPVAPAGVLFDFDGTIARTLGAWTEAYRQALRNRGVDLTFNDAVQCCFHRHQDDVIAEYKVSEPESFKESVWDALHTPLRSVDLYPHFREALTDLKALGCKTAVVTNSRRGHVQPVLERLELLHLFDTVITVEDVSYGKPDPQMIVKALNTLKVPTPQTFMVGDSTADLISGRRAGVKTVAFIPEENHPYHSLSTLREEVPTFELQHYRDLVDLMCGTPDSSEEASSSRRRATHKSHVEGV